MYGHMKSRLVFAVLAAAACVAWHPAAAQQCGPNGCTFASAPQTAPPARLARAAARPAARAAGKAGKAAKAGTRAAAQAVGFVQAHRPRLLRRNR